MLVRFWCNVFGEQLAVSNKDFDFRIPLVNNLIRKSYVSKEHTPWPVNILRQAHSCPSLKAKFEPFDS